MEQKDKVEVPWVYEGSIVTEESVPEWAVSYVYLIQHEVPGGEGGGKTIIYVGKKALSTNRRKRIGVREKAATKTKKTYKVEKKSSNWSEYWGSSKSLLQARESGIGEWHRTILHWCYSKKNATYLELRTQMQMRVLEEYSYNENINGSIYRPDTNRQLWEEYKKKQADNRANKPKKV